jgi:hypothetical protein
MLQRSDWLPQEPRNWDGKEVFQKGRVVSPNPWLDQHGNAFQPGSHSFVGAPQRWVAPSPWPTSYAYGGWWRIFAKPVSSHSIPKRCAAA